MLANDTVDISAISLPDFAASGAIGSSASTVDIASNFVLTQSTAGISLTLPTPTNTSARRMAIFSNSALSTVPVRVGGEDIGIGSTMFFMWTGTAWSANKVFHIFQLVNAQTGTTYTTTAADESRTVTLNNAAAITVTCSGLADGDIIAFEQLGVGVVTFVAGTLTPRHVANLTKTAGQYARVYGRVSGTDLILSGDMA